MFGDIIFGEYIFASSSSSISWVESCASQVDWNLQSKPSDSWGQAEVSADSWSKEIVQQIDITRC